MRTLRRRKCTSRAARVWNVPHFDPCLRRNNIRSACASAKRAGAIRAMACTHWEHAAGHRRVIFDHGVVVLRRLAAGRRAGCSFPSAASQRLVLHHQRVRAPADAGASAPSRSIATGCERMADRWRGSGRHRRADSMCRIISTRPIWICSATAACINCCARRARPWARTRWRNGCWRPRTSRPFATGTPASRICATGWTCARTWRSRATAPPIYPAVRTPPRLGRRPESCSTGAWIRWSAPLLAALAVAACVAWAVWGIRLSVAGGGARRDRRCPSPQGTDPPGHRRGGERLRGSEGPGRCS